MVAQSESPTVGGLADVYHYTNRSFANPLSPSLAQALDQTQRSHTEIGHTHKQYLAFEVATLCHSR